MSNSTCNYSNYFGFLKLGENPVFPENCYVIRRYREGTWLLEICIVKHGDLSHIGTVDMLEILQIANKSHLSILRKDEFYAALGNIFSIDIQDKLYATADVETVMKRVGRHSRDIAINKKIKKDFFDSKKEKDTEDDF